MHTLAKMNLTLKPTPIQRLNRISEEYGCNIFLKRDDLLGVGFGGNKLRKLEYILADAQKKKAKVIVASGSLQTNHGMLTALSASKTGMQCVLFLLIEESGEEQYLSGNLLLDDYIGCEIVFVDVADIMEDPELTVSEKDQRSQAVLDEAVSRKMTVYMKEHQYTEKDVYYVRSAGSTPVGICGYVDCVKEIAEQTQVKFKYIFSGNGSGGTYGGTLLGTKLYMPGTIAVGVGIEEMNPSKPQFILDLLAKTTDLLGCPNPVGKEDIRILQNSVNLGYAIPDEETMHVIETIARYEGVFLDPVYSGKIVNGALKYIKDQKLHQDDNVLIIHSGGTPGIFNSNMVRYRNDRSQIIDRWKNDTNKKLT